MRLYLLMKLTLGASVFRRALLSGTEIDFKDDLLPSGYPIKDEFICFCMERHINYQHRDLFFQYSSNETSSPRRIGLLLARKFGIAR